MNTLTIFALLTVTIVSAENFCTPGSFFKNDCNYCTCSQDGKAAACTDMACPESLTARQAGQFCQPGKTFQMDDCNTCTCSRDGKTAQCTLQFCRSPKNAVALRKIDRFCTPGTVFSPDNCNTCLCSKDGTRASCTLKACINPIATSNKRKQVCQPFTHFNDYCNACTCSDDGLSFGCTYMWCDKNIWNKDGTKKDVLTMDKEESLPQKQVCQPRSIFKDYCNTCTCSDDGFTFACTRMSCDKEIWNKDGSLKSVELVAKSSVERICAPKTQFKEQCNTCICSDDGFSKKCTMMTCLNRQNENEEHVVDLKSVPKQVCQPRSIFKDYCNTCTCSADGLTFACTRMLCDKEIWNKDGSLKSVELVAKSSVERICAPKTQFKEQCNTCICSDDGFSKKCTMMTCLNRENENEDHVIDLESVPKQVCQPRSTFKDYCNTCTCSVDGSTFACTKMACDKDIWNQDGSLRLVRSVAKSGVERICAPKTQFKEQCNTCICSDDGLSKMCTMMTCLNRKNEDEDHVDELESVPKQVCQPRAIFKDYCNTCTCSDDGLTFACTRMSCDKEIWNKDGSLKFVRSIAKSGIERVCTPKTQFKEQCNTCICSNNGLSKMCTMMTCNENLNLEDGSHKLRAREIKSESDKVCVPGKIFSPDGCNTCICNKDGNQMACTFKLCSTTFKRAVKEVVGKKQWGPLYKQGNFCEPGKLFYSECNRCVCTETGRSAICTLAKC